MVCRGDLRLLAAALAAGILAASLGAQTADEAAPILREEVHLVADARLRPNLLLMTLGGPSYCVQLRKANHVDASLLCADYGRDDTRRRASAPAGSKTRAIQSTTPRPQGCRRSSSAQASWSPSSS